MENTKGVNSESLDHFFRGAYSIDIVVITFHLGRLKILLQKKEEAPYEDQLGLPGKLILPNEDTDKALNKLLNSLIGTSDFYKKQLRAFSEVDRHPLGRVITFAYYGLVPYEQIILPLSAQLSWHVMDAIPTLSYDHNYILSAVLKRFRKGLLRHPNVFELLPNEFIISEMISIYEQAFNTKLDAPNFRKQVKNSQLVRALGKSRENKGSMGRPAELYTFDKIKYLGLKEKVQYNF